MGVDFDRESPGRVGRERELSDGARNNAFFDVITVKMEDMGLIACPPQFHNIAFGYADEPHGVGDTATFDFDVKSELRREDTGAPSGDQQQRQRPYC